jgi:hypothetical protein
MNIRLIIPNCNRNVSPLVAYRKRIADIAGGFTAWQATGGWIGGNGLCVELVTVFDCSVAVYYGQSRRTCLNVPKPIQLFRQLAADIARDLNQDCVYLSIDGVVEYVKR